VTEDTISNLILKRQFRLS
jgi:hypothetical protein